MKAFIVLVVFLLLAGCATPQRIELNVAPVSKPDLILPRANIILLKPVEWTLVTEDNVEQSFSNLAAAGRPLVFFSLTDTGYENLSLNFSDIRSLIQQQQTIIGAYERYYLESVQAIEAANRQLNNAEKQAAKINEDAKDSLPWWKSWWDNMSFD